MENRDGAGSFGNIPLNPSTGTMTLISSHTHRQRKLVNFGEVTLISVSMAMHNFMTIEPFYALLKVHVEYSKNWSKM